MSVDKDPINIDVQPIAESVATDAEAVLKTVEDAPPAVLLKTDDPVAIPSDLDFTPDEALNEILAVIPEQPAQEVKKVNDEPANVIESTTESAKAESDAPAVDVPATVTTTVAAAADDMNVETTVDGGNAEAENAMEATPSKPDEEKMDVDESNSVDAMDL